jgi:Putative beta barrel porin-7 (BBP7)
MAGRLAIGVAVAACFLTTGGLYAQGPASAAAPTVAAPNAYFGPVSSGAVGSQDMYGNYPPGNADAAPGGYPPQAGPHGYLPQSAYPPQYQAPPAPPVRQTNAYNDCGVTQAGDSDDVGETPFEEILSRVSRNIIFNVDYINWTLSKPSTELIGAMPTLATLNPVQNQVVNNFGPGFLAFFPANSLSKNPTQFFPVNNGLARAYDTSPFSLTENSGIQATLSLPLTFGTAELSGFTLQHANTQANMGGLPQGSPNDIPPDENFAAIPVKVNGMPSSFLGLYSESFQAGFSSLVFGGEFNIYFNPIVPKEYGLLIRPMVGFRYTGIQESFDVEAQNPGVSTTTIFSRTINNLYGPQVGLRIELVTQWFTIGADPRVMVGVNQFAASVDSSDSTIGSNSDYISTARFSAVGAIDAYVKIPIHDRVKLYAAYNLWGTGDISRPQSQIDYNVNESSGGVFTNDIHLDLSHSAFYVQGFAVGCEFNF